MNTRDEIAVVRTFWTLRLPGGRRLRLEMTAPFRAGRGGAA